MKFFKYMMVLFAIIEITLSSLRKIDNKCEIPKELLDKDVESQIMACKNQKNCIWAEDSDPKCILKNSK